MGKELKFYLPHAWFEKTSFAIADSLMDIFFQCSTIFYRGSKSHVVTIEGLVLESLLCCSSAFLLSLPYPVWVNRE